jgi:sugar/nucleoside kinase (ribokinase family)
MLKKIRQNYGGIIYLDVHTLSRGMGHHGDRDFKKIAHFDEWASCLDIIQANENEVKTLTDYDDEEEIARSLLKYGIKQLIITKGKAGAKVYYLQNGELNFIFQSALKIEAENHIGLGDIFEAAYFYNYIKTGGLYSALNIAVTASGLAAGHDGITKLKSL